MKKILASLLLSSMMLTQAQAGFGVVAGATAAKIIAENHDRNIENKVVPYVVSGIGLMFVSGVVCAIANKGEVFGPWGLLFFLDAQGNLAQEQIMATLQVNYPFLDNQEVVKNLSQTIKAKYEETKTDLVSLEAIQVERLLAPANLTEEQTNQIIEDLK